MDWTMVTRRTRQRRPRGQGRASEEERISRSGRRTIQIFVKVDGCKALPLDVSPTDKVGNVVRQMPSSECCSKHDVYVTHEGRVLRRSDELKNFEIGDGSTMQVTSRMRGGGKHQDKKSAAEKKHEE